MRRFKRILFVADGAPGEEAALRRAISLARENGAGLTLTELMAAPSRRAPLVGGERAPKKLQGLLSEERRASLERLAAPPPADEVTVRRPIPTPPYDPSLQSPVRDPG